jgi:hypothetical protein
MALAVSLIFLSKFDSVDIIFDIRSIAICKRNDSISPIELCFHGVASSAEISETFDAASMKICLPQAHAPWSVGIEIRKQHLVIGTLRS